MSDLEDYINIGVSHSWVVITNDDLVIPEFDPYDGKITKLASIDWDQVHLFGIRNIKTAETLALFNFPKGATPVWHHTSTVYINDNGRQLPQPIIDFCGVETDTYKTYCMADPNDQIQIITETKLNAE